MSIAIIIPVWNLWETMTLPCLASLAKHTKDQKIHIYLIDNGSTDGTKIHAPTVLKKLFVDATYFAFQENMGFAIACNQGAKLAYESGHDFLFFLNNDTTVTENWLVPLLTALHDKKIGAVGPLLLYPENNKVQHCGVSINAFGNVRHFYKNFPHDHILVHKNRYIRAITAAAFLCRTSDFMDVGMFHEAYKNGCEDLDLCYQFGKKGLFMQVIPKSIVYHHESQTPERSTKDNDNFKILAARHPAKVHDDPIIAKQDGYLPALTKEYAYCVNISPEKAQQFNTSMERFFKPEICEKLLLQEPLWLAGYDMLANHYENQNMPEKSLKYLETAFGFHPSLSYCEKILHLAKKMGNQEKIETFQSWKSYIMTQIKNIPNQHQYLAEMAKNDPIYLEILKNIEQ